MMDLTVAKLDKALDLTEARKEAISKNIALGDKAPVSPSQVDFSETLANVQRMDELDHVQVITTTTLGMNEINLDQDMLKMSSNALDQQALVKALNSKFELLNTAIKGDKP